MATLKKIDLAKITLEIPSNGNILKQLLARSRYVLSKSPVN
ncbi:hypothetical protein [Arcticibacterium luteifluviistationis]|nr:hypothetical protein [Arcticibacterium luteifluviistationis]